MVFSQWQSGCMTRTHVTHGKACYFNDCSRFTLGSRSKSNTFKEIERMIHNTRENSWNKCYRSWVQWVDLGALVAVQLSASILQSSHIKYKSLQVTTRTRDHYWKLVTREIWVSYRVGDISVTVTTKGFHILVFYTPPCSDNNCLISDTPINALAIWNGVRPWSSFTFIFAPFSSSRCSDFPARLASGPCHFCF